MVKFSGLLPMALVLAWSLAAWPGASLNAQSLSEIEDRGIERIESGQRAQQAVGALTLENRQLLDEYQAQLKLVQGLETYVRLLDTQLASQQEEISAIQRSITDVAVIERQILPLLLRMISALEEFISADIPFLPAERSARVEKLRALIGRSDVTVAEKARRVFEAFQIENDYGRTIESYTGKLELASASYDAEFLRIGRLALLYKTVGGGQLGYWDAATGDWRGLDRTPWMRMIDSGLSVARQEVAPQLIHLPFNPAEVGQ